MKRNSRFCESDEEEEEEDAITIGGNPPNVGMRQVLCFVSRTGLT